MTALSEVKAGTHGKILSVDGRANFQRRIAAVGITPGSSFSVVQNERKYPVLLDIRSTLLAVDRDDCAGVMVEPVYAGRLCGHPGPCGAPAQHDGRGGGAGEKIDVPVIEKSLGIPVLPFVASSKKTTEHFMSCWSAVGKRTGS